MKANKGDLYLLQDGTYADPAECTKGDDGKLRHASGLEVALTSDGEPMTQNHVALVGGSVAAAEAGRRDADEPGAPAQPVQPVRTTRAEETAEARRPAAASNAAAAEAGKRDGGVD